MAETTRRGVLKGGLIAIAAAAPAKAADDAAANRPFVEHRLVLQISDRDPAKQALVLSVCSNVLKEIGADRVAIEVVAFGPGVDLLRADAAERARVDSLIAQDVRFDICMNTVETIERDTGMKFPVNPAAHPVPAGVVRILNLVEQGYTAIRP